jgi:Tol biopolymer transport system component
VQTARVNPGIIYSFLLMGKDLRRAALMLHTNVIDRRAFLAGTAAALAGCSLGRNRTSLGQLAWSNTGNLWLLDLPDGKPRRIATGDQIGFPRFSPSGRWISFQDGTLGRVVHTTGDAGEGPRWTTGEVGQSPMIWLGNRDELAVHLADPKTGDESLQIFTAADNWRAPQRSIPFGLDADFGLAAAVDRRFDQYAYSSSVPLPSCADCGVNVRATLLLGSFARPGEPKPLAESAGFFDVAGFTPDGSWLVYWKSNEFGAAVREDGLDVFAANTRDGKIFDPKIVALCYSDMIAISPTKQIVAVTAGVGRETWAQKAIAIIDLTQGDPSVSVLTDLSATAQLPAWSPDGDKLAWCSAPAATQETIDRCMRLRRIYVRGIRPNDHPQQLLNDPAYADERPMWSRDGSHILFCRADATVAAGSAVKDPGTVWLMRSDGSEPRQVAGPFNIGTIIFRTYFGYTDWGGVFDWWRGPAA